MYRVKVGDEQIDDALEACVEQETRGETRYPGMSYEQGVDAAIRWVVGLSNDHPLEDEE